MEEAQFDLALNKDMSFRISQKYSSNLTYPARPLKPPQHPTRVVAISKTINNLCSGVKCWGGVGCRGGSLWRFEIEGCLVAPVHAVL